MSNSIESNVGKCAFSISFTSAKADSKMAELFLGYHLWHKVQSLMFAGGKKAKFTKESPWSPELQAHAEKVASEELGKFYEGLVIKTTEEVKATEEQKYIKFCISLGMTEEIARAGWKTAQEAKAKAQPAEVKEEKVLEG